MKYIYFDFDGQEAWLEVTEDHCALRQVSKQIGQPLQISAKEPCLADQEVLINEETLMLTQAEFEQVWEESLQSYLHMWQLAKERNVLGKQVEAQVAYFYPQGTIVAVEGIQGILTIDSLVSFPNAIKVGDRLSVKVVGYDDVNQWLKLERGWSVEVCFDSSQRQSFPIAGYRPHVVLIDDFEKEYLGVVFSKFSDSDFNQEIGALLFPLYQHSGYQKIGPGKTFNIYEGPHCVGNGKFI